MQKNIIILLFFLLSGIQHSFSQQLIAKESMLEMGTIESAMQIVYQFTIYNKAEKINYILKADAVSNCNIQIDHKKLLPNDSAILIVTYQIVTAGYFSEDIRLYSGNIATPLLLTIKGNVKNVAVDDLQACHPSAKNRKHNITRAEEASIFISGYVFDVSNKTPIRNAIIHLKNIGASKEILPDYTGNFDIELGKGLYEFSASCSGYRDTTILVNTLIKIDNIKIPMTKMLVKSLANKSETKVIEVSNDTLLENKKLPSSIYGPNQLIFLIDKSASMKEPNKLPALKIALSCMLTQLRKIDFVTVITYATQTRIVLENISANNVDSIMKGIDTLSAKGQTFGGKGIALAYELAKKHLIANGNNEIILATDGEFKLKPEDENLFKSSFNVPIKFSVLAFGNDAKDLWQLYKISLKGRGSYLQVKSSNNICNSILDEIKERSKK